MQVPVDVEEVKGDLLLHLITQEINHIRDIIERAFKTKIRDTKIRIACLSKDGVNGSHRNEH